MLTASGLPQRPTATLWGDESTRLQLLRWKVPADRIVVSGIPVRQAFRFHLPRQGGPRELLVMGGGLGLIPHAESLLSAMASAPDIHVTVITGKNESLRRRCRSSIQPLSHRVYRPSG